MNIELSDKLGNMLDSEISTDVYNLIYHNETVYEEVKNAVKGLIPKYDISDDDDLYECDAIYMEAIVSVLGSLVTDVKCGQGMIKLKSFVEARDRLVKNVRREIEEFRTMMTGKDAQTIYTSHYKILFFEEYSILLTSDFIEHYDDIIYFLSDTQNPLQWLYSSWISCDAHLSLEWYDMVEWMNGEIRDAMLSE